MGLKEFLQKVDTTGDCWIWTGRIDGHGYGAVIVGKHGKGAHRLSWVLHRGPIPKGMCVLHKCDNPPCVNPDHLFIGTIRDNVHDMCRKGRHVGLRKITAKQAQWIRDQYATGLYTQREIGDSLGIHSTAVSKIIVGKRWNKKGRLNGFTKP